MYTVKKLSVLSVAATLLLSTLITLVMPALANAAGAGDRYLIDFGGSITTKTTGWNNISGTQAMSTTTTYPLVDAAGNSTGATLKFTDAFTCSSTGNAVTTAGTTSSSLYPSTATQDALFLGTTDGGVCNQNDTSATLVVSGLGTNTTYDVKFYASRNTTDAGGRTANYTVGTSTVQLNANNNVNNIATITDAATVNGAITATVARAPGNWYGYLGVLELVKKADTTPPTATNPVVNAGSDKTLTLPAHDISLSGSAIAGTDATITSYAWTEVSTGGATFTSATSATAQITDLAVGTYTFRLTVTDSKARTGSDEVNVLVQPQVVAGCSAKKLVVIGSSSAYGTGASPISNSWVNRYTTYFKQLNGANSVVNLAVAGYSSYQLLPTGASRPSGRPASDTAHNITAAIAKNPSAIVVNLPSNDIASGYGLSEAEANLQTIKNAAAQAGIPIWITTTQPRDLDAARRADQLTLKNWIQTTYTDRSLDYWTTVANTDGTIASVYAYGDGVHLNNSGHQKLYNRIAGSNLVTVLCS